MHVQRFALCLLQFVKTCRFLEKQKTDWGQTHENRNLLNINKHLKNESVE